MNLLVGILIGVIFFPLYNIFRDVADLVVDRSTHQIVAKAPDTSAPREEVIEMVVKPTPKPRDPKQEMFMETCPKYGFSENQCERIWKQDVQMPLTPKAKDVKIVDIETTLIEETE